MTEHVTVDKADLESGNPVVVTDTLIATGYIDDQGNFIADEQPKTEVVAFVQQEEKDSAPE